MGKYNRAVIIATNVAEASITIGSLQYVIDIGYQFNVSYDFKTGINKLTTTKITESSRIQRRGRVGRTQDGTVYYMYKKDSRKYIKQLFNICSEDLSDKIYNLLTDNYFDTNFLQYNDNILIKKEDINEKKSKEILNRISIYNRTGYNKILEKQYMKYNTFYTIGYLKEKYKYLFKTDNYNYNFINNLIYQYLVKMDFILMI